MTDRRRQPVGLSEILDSVLRGVGVGDLGLWKRIESGWAELAGEPWSQLARPLALSRATLLVEVDSGAAASLLRYGTAGLTHRLNAALGADEIKDVKVRLAGRPRAG